MNLSYDKVLYTGPMEYALLKDGKAIGKDGKELGKEKSLANRWSFNPKVFEKNKEILTKVRHGQFNPDQWLMGSYDGQYSSQSDTSYGGIYDYYAYLTDRYGTGWSLLYSGNVTSIYPNLMTDYDPPGTNNCVLTALTTIFEHWRYQGYTNIPSSTYTIYNDVKTIATNNYGYTSTGGVAWSHIGYLALDLWDYYNYPAGSAYDDAVVTWGKITNEVNYNRPPILSLTGGYYNNHSITVVGYKEYQRYWYDDNVEFINVYDGWDRATRYIDWDVMQWGGEAIFLGLTMNIHP